VIAVCDSCEREGDDVCLRTRELGTEIGASIFRVTNKVREVIAAITVAVVVLVVEERLVLGISHGSGTHILTVASREYACSIGSQSTALIA
jgi:hypothetical protein